MVRVAASFNCFFLKSFLALQPCPHFLFCDFRKKLKCYDTLRKHSRREKEVPLEDVEFALFDPSCEEIASNEAWEILRHALAKLRPEDRLVITLLNLEEKSIREVSALTGWSESNVKVRAFRARNELKKILGGNNGK